MQNGENHVQKKPKRREYRHGNHMFTTRSHSMHGIMSVILAVVELVSIALAVILTFYRGGEAPLQYGTVLLVCTIFAVIGIGVGIYAKMQKDKYYVSAYVGIILNALSLVIISMILYAGAYGI